MENDLISRNAMFDAMRDAEFQTFVPLDEVDEVIANVPSIEAEPVRHGRWVEWWPGSCALIMTGEEMLWMCSECEAKYSDKENMNYCPNCGAKMNAKEDDHG